MAARAPIIRTLLRTSSTTVLWRAPRRAGSQSYPQPFIRGTQSIPQIRIQRRWESTSTTSEDWKIWDYEKVKNLVGSKGPKTILIDVREPSEYSAGHIPTAKNMPITSSADALFLSAEDFSDRFGFPKPSANAEVVFYCKAGIRSKAAATLARQVGFQNVGEYRGSWDDWAKKSGEKA